MININRRRLLALGGASVALGALGAAGDDATPAHADVGAATAELRRVVDAQHPLVQITYSTDDHPDASATRVAELWEAALDDASPELAAAAYLNVSVAHRDLVNGDLTKDGVMEWIDAVLAEAQAHGIPAVLQILAWISQRQVREGYGYTESEIAALVEKYDVIIGLSAVELAIGGGFTPEEVQLVADWLNFAAAHGLLFIWKEASYPRGQKAFKKMFTDDAYADLYNTIVQHRKNVVMVDKTLSPVDAYFNHSAPMGMWLADLIDNWGANLENFVWGPYVEVDGPVDAGPYDKFRLANFPDAMYGAMMLRAVSAGATVYSFEHRYQLLFDDPDHGYRAAPGWKYVLRPLLEQVLIDGIPDRAAVTSKTPVAYRASAWDAPEIAGELSPLFSGLNSGPHDYSFLPTTGRYFFVPVLPKYYTGGGFNDIITAEDFSGGVQLSNLDNKRAYFNQRYPEFYTGDAWLAQVGPRCYMFNPLENVSVDTSFAQFDPGADFFSELNGSFGGQTFDCANVAPDADVLSVFVSNYRSDVFAYQDMLPAGYFDTGDNPYPTWRSHHWLDFMKVVTDQPDRATLRTTTLSLSGLADAPVLRTWWKPAETVCTVTEQFQDGTYRVTMRHNGPFRFDITTVSTAIAKLRAAAVEYVGSAGHHPGSDGKTRSLTVKLDQAAGAYASGERARMRRLIEAFARQIDGEAGGSLTAEQKAELLQRAEEIK